MFDESKLVECPTLTPTEMEFGDPIGYLSRPDIKQLGYKYGIVKVVPPEGWKPGFSLSSEFKFHTRLQKLSDLGITTRSRKLFTENINRFLKMKKKKQLETSFSVGNIDVYYYDLFVQVEKLSKKGPLSANDWLEINLYFNVDPNSKDLQSRYNGRVRNYAEYLNSNLTDKLPESDSEDEDENCLICGKHGSPTLTLLCDNCDNPYHLKCIGLEDIPPGTWFCKKCLIGTGEYGFKEEVDNKFSLHDFLIHCNKFTQEFINEHGRVTLKDIEKFFWDFVGDQRSDIEVRYGADIHNLVQGQISGFPMNESPDWIKNMVDRKEFDNYASHPFNLTNLPYSKGSLLNYINHSISGMTVPWIYVGSMFSTFCWHVEDHYTLSANYCHFGSTKKWYGIPASDSDKFERLMRSTAPDLFKRQPDLLHQLVTLLSPMKLVENGIRCYYANQNPNEFVITYPKVYHAGFNSGFNFNEAVNFTMDMWLEYGENSIDDYKLIKKENVFNHYKLMENVLVNFVANKEQNLDLVQRCLASYKRFVSKTTQLMSLVDAEDFVVKENEKEINYEYYLETDNKDEEDEEDLCDICKTHISHVFCLINNRHHTFNSKMFNDVQEVVGSKPQTKMSITQLITPENSPQEQITGTFKDQDVSELKRTLEASDALSGAVDREIKQEHGKQHPESEPDADEESEQPNKKRRKSGRISGTQKHLSTFKSKMSLIKNKDSMDQLNAKRDIKLCLQCTSKLQQIPHKSQMIVNVSVQEMNRFIREIEAKLM